MAGTHRHLLIIRPPNGKFIVTPGHFHVVCGDIIHWKTIGTAAHLIFPPNTNLFVEPGPHDIVADADLVRTLREVQPGIYSYSVLCDATKEFAEGGSDPELIVCT